MFALSFGYTPCNIATPPKYPLPRSFSFSATFSATVSVIFSAAVELFVSHLQRSAFYSVDRPLCTAQKLCASAHRLALDVIIVKKQLFIAIGKSQNKMSHLKHFRSGKGQFREHCRIIALPPSQVFLFVPLKAEQLFEIQIAV